MWLESSFGCEVWMSKCNPAMGADWELYVSGIASHTNTIESCSITDMVVSSATEPREAENRSRANISFIGVGATRTKIVESARPASQSFTRGTQVIKDDCSPKTKAKTKPHNAR